MNDRNLYSDGTAPNTGDRVNHYMDTDTGTVLAVEPTYVKVRWDEDGIQRHRADELTRVAS